MYWCFTLNDNPRSFWTELGDLYTNVDQIKYICGQLERGEETNRLHFQGYVQLSRSMKLSWVRNNISDTAHWEKQKGTNEQARDYCSKEDSAVPHTFAELGVFKPGKSGQGKRNDVAKLVVAIKEGKSQRDIIEDPSLVNTFARYIRFHDRVRSLYKPKQHEDGIRIELFVGAPRTGKTRLAYEKDPDLFELPISNGTAWFDGYDGHQTVLIDDFMGAGSKVTLDNTLKLLDRYVRQVPIKGGHVWFNPKVIYVTSNYHPRTWWKWNTTRRKRETSYEALCGRINKVTLFFKTGKEERDVKEYFYDTDQWPEENENDEHGLW